MKESILEEHGKNWYSIGKTDERERILELIDEQIEYFKVPETIINKAMVSYLNHLKDLITTK